MAIQAATGTIATIAVKSGEQLVFGLCWQPLPKVGMPSSAVAALLAKEKYPFFVMHEFEQRAQYGAIKQWVGTARGFSGVLWLMPLLGPSWLGIFQLPDARYLLAGVHDGQVVPGCDQVFQTEDEALERFREYEPLFPWSHLYAPQGLIDDATPCDFSALLAQAKLLPSFRIKHIHEASKRLRSVLRNLVLGLGFFGLTGWIYRLQHTKQEALRQAAFAASLAQVARQDTIQVWKGKPPAASVLTACSAAIGQFPLTLGGWNFSQATCDGKNVTALYKYQPGTTVDEFISVVSLRYPKLWMTKQGQEAQIQDTVTPSSGDRREEQLQDIQLLGAALLSKIQKKVVSGALEDLLSGAAKKSAGFTLEGPLSPISVFEGLSLDGVVIETVSVALLPSAELRWKTSGSLYGQ